ncbi:MAG: hypothetical protein LBV19_08960 [Streptococcaceae bacterium]|jgi:hypothetical protein|nr:hypothetical protein [Streptococcaceae bacterium]
MSEASEAEVIQELTHDLEIFNYQVMDFEAFHKVNLCFELYKKDNQYDKYWIAYSLYQQGVINGIRQERERRKCQH